MITKIKAFITLSLLGISFSSFAIHATCPSKEYLQPFVTAGVRKLPNVPGMVGTMSVGPVVPSSVANMPIDKWISVVISVGGLICSYQVGGIGQIDVASYLGGWRAVGVNDSTLFPWDFNATRCNLGTHGTRETCVASIY